VQWVEAARSYEGIVTLMPVRATSHGTEALSETKYPPVPSRRMARTKQLARQSTGGTHARAAAGVFVVRWELSAKIQMEV
jgi:hypothetical protein